MWKIRSIHMGVLCHGGLGWGPIRRAGRGLSSYFLQATPESLWAPKFDFEPGLALIASDSRYHSSGCWICLYIWVLWGQSWNYTEFWSLLEIPWETGLLREKIQSRLQSRSAAVLCPHLLFIQTRPPGQLWGHFSSHPLDHIYTLCLDVLSFKITC